MRARPGLISIDRRGTNLSDGSGCRRGATRTQSGNGPLCASYFSIWDQAGSVSCLWSTISLLTAFRGEYCWKIGNTFTGSCSRASVSSCLLKTTSFQRWAKRLDQLAQTRELQRELGLLDRCVTAYEPSPRRCSRRKHRRHRAHVHGFAFD